MTRRPYPGRIYMQLPPPLNGLSADEQGVLIAQLKRIHFAANQPIFHVGDPSDGCYIIETGQVRLEVGGEQHVDAEPVLGYLNADSILGELGVLDGLCRSVTAYADTEVEAAHLSSAAIEELCMRYPSIGVGVFRALARDASLKLRRTTARLTERLADDGSDDLPDSEVDRIVFQS